MEIKNFKKAANRIKQAVKEKERIILYGDADLDGIASVIILKETIKNLGGEVDTVYFPDRESEGYGLNKTALKILKPKAPALLVTLDLGIGNVKEVLIAKELRFEVIIIDHHQVLEKVPQASIIIDPKQKEDKYPFKEFANAGIVYKFSQLLLGKKMSASLNNNFLELTALATIADMMVEDDENKGFIEEGLKILRYTFRPSLRILWDMSSVNSVSDRQIAQNMIGILNAGRTISHLNEAYSFLISTSLEEAKEQAVELKARNLEKKLRIKEITAEVEEVIAESEGPIVFEGGPDWHLILIGSVASRICDKFDKPTFIFKKTEKESPGTVRVPKGINAVEAMASCKHLLETFGGHPAAAGFRVKKENIAKFKEGLIKYFKNL